MSFIIRTDQSAVLLAIMMLVNLVAAADTVSVSTEYGMVRGLRVSGISAFLGIPFAKPPVEALRWRAPVEPDSWYLLDAFDFSPECSQMLCEQESDSCHYTGSENCLYLNVWTPVGAVNRPVMVFIHGGANQQGSASRLSDGVYMYDGQYLASHENVIVVTVQYRLGPFGFLVHPGLAAENSQKSSGNYGLLDQIMALRWVKRNITAFGGDTSKVMVFGESAGALDICALLVSPPAAGLFTRALIESGAPIASPYRKDEIFGISYLRDTLKCLGRNETEILSAARALPPESVLVATVNTVAGGVVNSSWGPTIDGYVIKEEPLAAMKAGRFNKVAVVVGSNAEEMSIAAPLTVTPSMVNLLLRASVPQALLNDALALYPPGENMLDARISYIGILTDAQFTVNARRTAQALTLHGGSVYRYFFSHTMSGVKKTAGAFHGLELMYVFRTFPLTQSYGLAGKFTQNDSLVMNMVSGYWARFAEMGNPNSSGELKWPLYTIDDDPYIEISSNPIQEKNLRKEKCDFWDKVADSRIPVLEISDQSKWIRTARLAVSLAIKDAGKHAVVYLDEDALVYDLCGRSLRSIQSKISKGVMIPSGLYIVIPQSRNIQEIS
jgi:para-nitrobenzyl esterase